MRRATAKIHEEIISGDHDPGQLFKLYPSSPIEIPINVYLNNYDKSDKYTNAYAEGVAESYAHDVFLIMNISLPGSCNFYKATFISSDRASRPDRSLCEALFDCAYLDSSRNEWPALKHIDLEQVIQWYYSVRKGCSQTPTNPMEKVLFSLLHISKLDISPVTVIWIFYALETLFDTKSGENFRILMKRLGLLLCPDAKQAKHMNKKMRELYDIRSSLVHGGFEVSHPLHNERLDGTVEKQADRLLAVTDFGFRLLLRSIQIAVERGWRWPQFDEVVSGDTASV